MSGVRFQSPLTRTDMLRKAEAALAPVEGVPEFEELQDALGRQASSTLLLEFAYSTDVSHHVLHTTKTWFTLAEGFQAPLEIRYIPLDGIKAINLCERAAAASFVLLSAEVKEPLRSRIVEYAAGLRGGRLIVLGSAQMDKDLQLILSSSTDLESVDGWNTISTRTLADVLGIHSDVELEALKGEARVLTARRLLAAGQCLLRRQQRLLEGEILITRYESSLAGIHVEDPFAGVLDELVASRRTMKAFAENQFEEMRVSISNSLSSFQPREREENAAKKELLFEVPSSWLDDTREQVNTVSQLAIQRSVDFLMARLRNHESRIRTMLLGMGASLPVAAPTFVTAALCTQVRHRIGEIQIAVERLPKRTFFGAVRRDNPLTLLMPVLSIFGLVGMFAPENTLGLPFDLGQLKKPLYGVIMGAGGIFFLFGVVTAPARLKRERESDRSAAHEKLKVASKQAVARALSDCEALMVSAIDAHLEQVRAWLGSSVKPAQNLHNRRPGPELQQLEQVLRVQHRALSARVRKIAEVLEQKL